MCVTDFRSTANTVQVRKVVVTRKPGCGLYVSLIVSKKSINELLGLNQGKNKNFYSPRISALPELCSDTRIIIFMPEENKIYAQRENSGLT